MSTTKKISIVLFSVIAIALFFVFLYTYIRKPDLVIESITSSAGVNVCKYTVEIKNKGFTSVNESIGYCFWPEGKEKCKFLWDVVNRDPETGKTDPLILAPGEKYKFEVVDVPKHNFDGECPNKLHFCIDCNLRIEYGKEIIDGSVEELNENNNDYTYTK